LQVQSDWLAYRSVPDAANWLAADGFVAAVVKHPAIPAGPPAQSVLDELWLRPADISAGVSAILGDAGLAGKIDPAGVGAVGFFVGGYSVMELVGARPVRRAFGSLRIGADARTSP
jgi:predicted dienelactone hydrolase